MSVALKVRNGCKSFPNSTSKKSENVKILSDFNLTVRRGSIYCLIGPSGAGKTTLFSCILGISQLDSGEISIFNRSVSESRELAKIPSIVGYMPQETSLVEELTVVENLRFFANLYEMKIEDFDARFGVLKKVLEIPNDNQQVATCSGGQKRRISFAIAILCEPALLFLDEPTVGVDPILRENIWKFLRNMVSTKNTTVIVTTHYINEAEQSDCVGMLRKGRLLVEDSPSAILEKFQLDGLDDVFAHLCTIDGAAVEVKEENSESLVTFQGVRKTFSWQRLKALVKKEFLVLKRQPKLFIIGVLLPILTLYIFSQEFEIPRNLAFGIVNKESNCSNFNTSAICEFENFSCRQIHSISKQEKLNVVNYKNFNDAYRDGKAGKLLGILNFRENASKIFERRVDSINGIEVDEDLYAIDFYPDYFDLHLSQFASVSLQDAVEDFLHGFFVKECNHSWKFSKISPIHFEEPIFGVKNATYKEDMFSTFLFGMLFMVAMNFCCLCIIHDRSNGSWNRELLSGVSIFEVIFAHFLANGIIMILLLLGCALVIYFGMGLTNHGNLFLECSMATLIYIAGMCFGFLFSCSFENYTLAVYSSIGLTLAQIYLSGSIWPYEGMFYLLKPLAWILPIVLPSHAFKNIYMKGYLTHHSVPIGFIVTFSWIIGSLLLMCLILRKKRFFAG